jgi:hypothetical protein
MNQCVAYRFLIISLTLEAANNATFHTWTRHNTLKHARRHNYMAVSNPLYNKPQKIALLVCTQLVI